MLLVVLNTVFEKCVRKYTWQHPGNVTIHQCHDVTMALNDCHVHFNMAGTDNTTFQLEEDECEEAPHSEVLPLNSRHLTITMLKQFAWSPGFTNLPQPKI